MNEGKPIDITAGTYDVAIATNNENTDGTAVWGILNRWNSLLIEEIGGLYSTLGSRFRAILR